jgi:hypothetical protein
MPDYDELTWEEAMRRGHAALLDSEDLYDDINASEGRSNLDIEKHLPRAEVNARPGPSLARARPRAWQPRRPLWPPRHLNELSSKQPGTLPLTSRLELRSSNPSAAHYRQAGKLDHGTPRPSAMILKISHRSVAPMKVGEGIVQVGQLQLFDHALDQLGVADRR